MSIEVYGVLSIAQHSNEAVNLHASMIGEGTTPRVEPLTLTRRLMDRGPI